MRTDRDAGGRVRSRIAWLAAAIAASLAAPGGAAAQVASIQCVRPAPDADGAACTLRRAAGVSVEPIVVRVVDAHGAPLQGEKLTFRSATGGLLGAATTDHDGIGVLLWTEPMPGVTGAVVAETTVGGIPRFRTIEIAQPKKPSGRTISSDGSPDQVWFVDRQLPKYARVRVNGASAADCGGVVVRLRARGDGASAPDSVYAAWNARTGTCTAESPWRVGKDVGEYLLQASLAGEPDQRVEFRAKARALPRLVAGVSLTAESPYTRVVPGRKRVVRTITTTPAVAPATGSVQTQVDVESTFVTPGRSESWLFTPVLGVDWAPYLPVTRLRVMAGAAVDNARHEWVAGFSLPQVFQSHGFHREAVGVDFHLAVHFERRTDVLDVTTTECPLGIEALARACPTTKKSFRPTGVGLMLTVDGIAALGQLAGIFGAKLP